jgi:HTH-type transcriptional regulator/antitoxin PezA
MDNFIGLNISYLCVKNKLTQKEFGDLFYIKQSTISTYLANRSNPQVETIQKICTHFNITIDEFINVDLSKNAGKAAMKDIEPIEKPLQNNLSEAKEPGADYIIKKATPIIDPKDKTIEILEREVQDLREDKQFLKGVIDANQGKARNAS